MYTCDCCGEVLEEHTYAKPCGMFCSIECRQTYEENDDNMRLLRQKDPRDDTVLGYTSIPRTQGRDKVVWGGVLPPLH